MLGGTESYRLRLAYLVDEKQLTKDCREQRQVTGEEKQQSEKNPGKILSHWESEFPSRGFSGTRRIGQRPRELNGDQVEAFGMGHPQNLGAEVAGGGGQRCQRSQGSAGNLKQKLGG
jgi:hypothetical protein